MTTTVLFTAGKIGTLHLPNRLIRSATAERMADADGAPREQLKPFYQELARGGVGLIISGHMYVHPSGKCHPEMTGIYSDKLIPGLAELADTVDSAVFPKMQGKPLMHILAAKAVTFHEAMRPEFADYQKAIIENALALAVELQNLGLRLVSGGTDNHLILVDLTETGVTGAHARLALEAAGIVTNKNSIPFDSRPPAITSGVRLGTPAVTTRGFGKEEMKLIADLIVRVLTSPDDEKVRQEVKQEVERMCSSFPVPGIDD